MDRILIFQLRGIHYTSLILKQFSYYRLCPKPASPDSSGIAATWLNQSGFKNLTGLGKARAAIKTDSGTFCDDEA